MDVRKLLFEPMLVVVLYFSPIPSVLISCDVLRWCATLAHIMGSNPTCASNQVLRRNLQPVSLQKYIFFKLNCACIHLHLIFSKNVNFRFAREFTVQ